MRAVCTDKTAGIFACTPTEAVSEDHIEEGLGIRFNVRFLNVWSDPYRSNLPHKCPTRGPHLGLCPLRPYVGLCRGLYGGPRGRCVFLVIEVSLYEPYVCFYEFTLERRWGKINEGRWGKSSKEELNFLKNPSL